MNDDAIQQMRAELEHKDQRIAALEFERRELHKTLAVAVQQAENAHKRLAESVKIDSDLLAQAMYEEVSTGIKMWMDTPEAFRTSWRLKAQETIQRYERIAKAQTTTERCKSPAMVTDNFSKQTAKKILEAALLDAGPERRLKNRTNASYELWAELAEIAESVGFRLNPEVHAEGRSGPIRVTVFGPDVAKSIGAVSSFELLEDEKGEPCFRVNGGPIQSFGLEYDPLTRSYSSKKDLAPVVTVALTIAKAMFPVEEQTQNKQVQVSLSVSLEDVRALKKFLSSTDEFDDREAAKPLFTLYEKLLEAAMNQCAPHIE